MKTIFRFLSLGLLLTGMMAVSTTAIFAQDPCADADGQTALYTKFTELYPKKDLADRKAAIDTGKQFLEKYGSCEPVKEQADYLKTAIPKMEETYKKVADGAARSAILKRFDAAVPAKKWDEAYAAGNEFVNKYPNDDAQINIIIPMGLIGLIESFNNNFKYNDDTLKYARMVISQLNGSVKCIKIKDGKPVAVCGSWQFEQSKEEVLSDMNYAIAYITYHVKKDQKGALPYYFEVAQTPGKNQKEPRVYVSIGNYYLEQRKPIGVEIARLIALQKEPGTDEEKLAREAEIKGKIALFNGYSERAMDAFVRAHNVAASTPANKAYKDSLYKNLQDLYEQRFEKKEGLDKFIATTVAKSLPNPTSEVTPVVDPEPVKTTTTTSTTPAAAKPAVVVPTKLGSATTKTSANEKSVVTAPNEAATSAKAKTFAKKPVMKRKGTR